MSKNASAMRKYDAIIEIPGVELDHYVTNAFRWDGEAFTLPLTVGGEIQLDGENAIWLGSLQRIEYQLQEPCQISIQLLVNVNIKLSDQEPASLFNLNLKTNGEFILSSFGINIDIDAIERIEWESVFTDILGSKEQTQNLLDQVCESFDKLQIAQDWIPFNQIHLSNFILNNDVEIFPLVRDGILQIRYRLSKSQKEYFRDTSLLGHALSAPTTKEQRSNISYH